MTAHKHLKQIIRVRMEKTGERYAAARRVVLASAEETPRDPATRWHFAGNVPAATALRTLLAHAGVRAPHTGEPFSEAMLFGIAGGIGIGVMGFYYAKADVATFYVAGRHQWHDHVAYLQEALAAFEIKPVIAETTGAGTAQKQLAAALEKHGPAIAWVENYRVITVYSIDEKEGTARIGDLTDDPIPMTLKELSATRLRVKNQKCRLLSIPSGGTSPDLKTLVDRGLKRCAEVLANPTLKQAPGNCRLEALKTWAERMHGSNDAESWSRQFQPGPNLWRGLRSVYNFIELFGTGGGLCRPLFADFLEEAGTALARPELKSLAKQYAALGRQWSELAEAALPDSVPELRTDRLEQTGKIEALRCGESREQPAGMDSDFAKPEPKPFPLSERESDELRAGLKKRILAIYEGEVAALQELRRVAGSDGEKSKAKGSA
jgi:hypothetical protein